MVGKIVPHIPFDYLVVDIKSQTDAPVENCSFLRIGFNEYQAIGAKELSVISGIKHAEINELISSAAVEKMLVLYNGADFENYCRQSKLKNLYAQTFQLCSALVYPIFLADNGIFTVSFYSRKLEAYHSDHLALLINLQQSLSSLASAISSATRSIENKPAIVTGFNDIVGNSNSLLSVLDLVTQVAPLDTSVLILGESGTGKERIADSLHNHSARKQKPLVKINCATLPHSLIESELFGHEKGAFTGAAERQMGKFELASGGTIFLDEIGELPLDQQVKLLRVLQEKEITRVGGKQAIKVDVRVIAATNRNLEKEVAEGRFRLDLYYRLNVFPIQLPALRERKDDIRQLAYHFARLFCKKNNRVFPGLSVQMLTELEVYHWPGNIRELENIIEQSMILNDGKKEVTLRRPLQPAGALQQQAINTINSLDDVKNLQQQNEKEYISAILKKAGGRIRGKGGAAELLNQKPTTLESRMARLGIKKGDFLI
ncbi:MAG: sigma-54 dependent transcriptional regulator [Flavipsychrobacter sp.]|nr:sigma-54 dependent transcriptional regulator [Flavipsychrobacter sp.]